jgi:hypothetical protein
MASPANTLAPPPDPNGSGTPPPISTAPAGASPSPAQPSGMQQGTQDLLQAVSLLRGIAKSYPAASPAIMKINDLIQEVSAAMMQSQTPGEPQAPPNAG